jgi:hydrogenase maturation protease
VRSDDGFGWHAARLIAQAPTGSGAQVVTCHQLTPELAEDLSQVSRAVFLDADCQGAPGEIHEIEVQPEAATPQAFTHTCTPAGLLAAAEQLYGRRPEATAITVSAQNFEFGDTLSPAVAAALPLVVERVRQLLGGG